MVGEGGRLVALLLRMRGGGGQLLSVFSISKIQHLKSRRGEAVTD